MSWKEHRKKVGWLLAVIPKFVVLRSLSLVRYLYKDH